jgi:hypothetical protein
MVQNANRQNEAGVALLLSILALMLLSAIAVTMMYMSATEKAIGANFKAEETEYFAARAGIEEVRDRMIPGVVNYSIDGLVANQGCPGNPASPNCYLPAAVPGPANGGVVYILQRGVTMADVTTPPAAGAPNPVFDDELCHDYTIGAMAQSPTPNVPCSGANPLPAGTAWYNPLPGAYGITSVPNGSLGGAVPAWAAAAGANANPLDWKWVRITWKANNSVLPYPVNGAAGNATPVCWNGYTEVPLAGAATCQLMPQTANPVYLVTALAVGKSGARRLIQAELAQTPSGGQPGGLFATGVGCGALSLGGGAKTYSFNSSAAGYGYNGAANPPVSNGTTSGGSIGANGNVGISGGAVVGGDTSTFMPDSVGNCNANNGITMNGAGSSYGTANQLLTAYTPPSPPYPTNPVPPTKTKTYNGSQTVAPGTYGSVKVTGGTITLGVAGSTTPAIYTMNSLTVSGGGAINIVGPVIININYSGNGDAVNIGGNGFVNTINPPIASDFVINYGGQGNVQVNGGAAAFAVINAPNANVTLNGGSNFFGQILGKTINDTGGTNFYWDLAANTNPVNTNTYFEIAMRELSY